MVIPLFSKDIWKLWSFIWIDTRKHLLFNRVDDEEEAEKLVKVDQALVSARAAYVKLRQRAQVLKVARDQGWNVARELAILQDEGEDPLLKKAMKNAKK